MITEKNLVIDCQTEYPIKSPRYVHEFDKQGELCWNRERFAGSLYEPEYRNGLKAFREMKARGLRSLNANALLWLLRNEDQIPESWKRSTVLFMGTIFGVIIPMIDPEQNLECFALTCEGQGMECDFVRGGPVVWRGGRWMIRPFNLSANNLTTNAKIAMFPE
jgi:hypothetical protein